LASNVNIVINGKNLASKAIQDVTKDLSSANSAGERFGSTMASIVKFGLGTALAGFGASLTGLFASMKKDAAWQQTSVQFETLTGDAQKAKLILGDLQKFAASTPLSFESIADGAINLMAFGTAAEDALGEMRMMGDLAMGNSEKMDRLVQAYGKLRSKGKASMEEINRFTEAGVPLLDQLGNNLGVSTEEVFKLVSAGRVGFVDVQEALRDLTSEGGKFAGMLEKQADTVNGKWSTLKDTLSLTMIKVGEAMRPFTSSVLDSAITKLNAFMESESFESFIGTTVRWASWAMDMLPKVGAVFWFVGEALDITARHVAQALDGLKDIVVESPLIRYVVELGGDAWEAIKKGLSTGDWSDAFGVGADLFRSGVVIAAALRLGSAAAGSLWTAIIMAMKGSSFLTSVAGVGTTGIIAGASVAVALVEATGTDNWDSFKQNISAAIIAGIAAGWLTKSPKVGVWVGTIALNLDLSGLTDNLPDPEEAGDALKTWIGDLWDRSGIPAWWENTGKSIGATFLDSLWRVISAFDLVGAFVDLWNLVSSKASTWWEDTGKSIGATFLDSLWRVISAFDLVGAFVDLWSSVGPGVADTIKGWFAFDLKPDAKKMSEDFREGFASGLGNINVSDILFGSMKSYKGSDSEKIEIQDIIASPEGFLTKYGATNAARGKLIEIWGIDTGRQILAGLGVGLGDIDSMGETAARTLIYSLREALGIRSPSKETTYMGTMMMEGFLKGLGDPGYHKKISSVWASYLERARDILGIHSASDEAEDDGKHILEGFLNGISNPTLREEILAAWQKLLELLDSLNTVDADTVISGITGPGKPQEDKKDTKKSGFSALWDSVVTSFNESGLGRLISGFGSTLSSFISGMGGAITSLGSIQAILDPLSTIFSGIMDVLSPVIDSLLSPLVGILRTVGTMIGSLIAPVLQWLAPIIQIVGETFTWLYNKILVPVGNAFIAMVNGVGVAITFIINGVISALNWVLGIFGIKKIGLLDAPALDSGFLQEISSSSLSTSGSSYIGGSSGSGVSGSSTSVQSYAIEVHQTIQGNVIGDGGLAALGEYFVRAVQAYMGNGGTVSFVRGS
jgi:tape measure domain-containing protein